MNKKNSQTYIKYNTIVRDDFYIGYNNKIPGNDINFKMSFSFFGETFLKGFQLITLNHMDFFNCKCLPAPTFVNISHKITNITYLFEQPALTKVLLAAN